MASPRPLDLSRLVREAASRAGPRVKLALDPSPAMVTAHEAGLALLLDLLIAAHPGPLLIGIYPSHDHRCVCLELACEHQTSELATARAQLEAYGGNLTAVPGTTTIELPRTR